MTFVFSGFSFVLHSAHHLASLSRPFVAILLLDRYFYSDAIGWCYLQVVNC